MEKIQIIAIIASLLFTFFVIRLIVRGKLREEYSIIWICCTFFLILFSFWREGLDYVSNILGIYEPPNFVFTVSVFMIFMYLLHISIVVSRLYEQNKKLAQEIALLKNKEDKKQ
ncbi:hypothetical protein ATE84_1823 [Aquimarina sp. MAR_2010_214]|uniref:DUF2304 domain-containing protein n=1 Tax=Aquimarina sp. MAR_2010_214 TaxID=1250026 RepID=UPI000CBD5928|nr:DUF2304 domain-containing protein [Aquimarina sp. MAR_2010_214]PKV49785.1 hypothetical protein ATE84_1823 [Aquimarina sp. MAR_2010_214]